MCSRIDR